MVKRLIAGLVMMLAVACAGTAAQAQFEVKQPEVHKGETEFAYHGSYYSGLPEPPAEVLRHGHEFELIHGVKQWWAFGVAGEVEKERGEDGTFGDLEFSEIEVQNKFVLKPLEHDGVGLSFFTVYGTSVASGVDAEELLFGPIVKVRRNRLSATGNLFLARAFDLEERHVEDGEAEIETTPDHWSLNYAWQVKYQHSERWGYGIEGFGEFEDIGNDVMGNEPGIQRLGPVIYLDLGARHEPHGSYKDSDGHSTHEDRHAHGPKLAFGVLFGLNGDTSDTALKWDLELEF